MTMNNFDCHLDMLEFVSICRRHIGTHFLVLFSGVHYLWLEEYPCPWPALGAANGTSNRTTPLRWQRFPAFSAKFDGH